LLPPLLVYLVVFGIAFIENLFPPSPSDLVVVFAGSLVALGEVGFPEVLVFATAGSALGFLVMYKVGHWFGVRIIEQGRLSFLPRDGLRKVEEWFGRYGYWVIVGNRFLSGTRAVVSFFAGLSELNLRVTTLLSLVSALVWNAALLGLGGVLGRNWEKVGFYLSTYSQIVTGIIVVIVVVIVGSMLKRKKKGPVP
jgi:membrane protein DedA with SNARE-associated domain